MNAPIKSPTNPLFPPAANTLAIDSFSGVPYSWHWSVGVTTTDKDQSSYQELRSGSGSMTEDEWQKWTDQPDNYLLQCAANHLGLELDISSDQQLVGGIANPGKASVAPS